MFRDPGLAKDGIAFPGLTVTLKRPDGSSLTTVTDANGNYRFCLLPPGTYTVTVTPPAGTTNSYDLDGNKDNSVTAALLVGQSNLDLDFGYLTVNVLPAVVTQTNPAPAVADTPALSYTGARSTLLVLWAMTFLLLGYGIFGLAGKRRRPSPR